MNKKCNCCGSVKPIEDFKWSNRREGTRANVCKKCDAEKQAKYQRKKRLENKEVKFTINKAQEEVIKQKAGDLNLTINRYAKNLLLEKEIGREVIFKDIERYGEIKALLSMLINQTKRIGVNINQLAYAYNSTGEINQPGISNLPAYMKYVSQMLNQLEELMQEGIV